VVILGIVGDKHCTFNLSRYSGEQDVEDYFEQLPDSEPDSDIDTDIDTESDSD
jgi:hypothetical protein